MTSAVNRNGNYCDMNRIVLKMNHYTINLYVTGNVVCWSSGPQKMLDMLVSTLQNDQCRTGTPLHHTSPIHYDLRATSAARRHLFQERAVCVCVCSSSEPLQIFHLQRTFEDSLKESHL